MRKRALHMQRVPLFFTRKQLEQLDAEAQRLAQTRASLVRTLVQRFLESVEEKKGTACHA